MTRAPTPTPRTTSDRGPAGQRPSRPPQVVGVDPVRVLRQNAWLLVLTLLVGGGLGVAAHFILLKLYPLYRGEVRFVLKPNLDGGFEVMTRDIDSEETVVRLAQTEAARITGRDNLLAAMRNPDVRQTTWAAGFNDESGAFDAEEAVDQLIERVSAGHRRGQQIFYLTWRTHEQRDVPIVLNSIADTYMASRRLDDERRYNQSSEVFRRQQGSLDSQILELKRQMSDFIGQHGITSGDERTDVRRAEELKELARQTQDTKKDHDVFRARRAQIEKRLEGTLEPSAEDVREADQDPVLMQARRDLNDLRTQLDSHRASFGPDHPTVRRLSTLVESSEQNLNTNRDEIIRRNLRANLKKITDDVGAVEDLLERQTTEYTKQSKELETITARMNDLNNMRDRLKQLEEDRKAMGTKMAEIATVRGRDDAARVEIVQRAAEPRELDFPKLKVMIPVMGVLVLAVVLVLLFTREFMDQRVRYTSDLAGLPGGRLLGVIPDTADDPVGVKNPRTVVRDHPDSVISEAYRQTAVQIAKGLEAGHKALLITTAMPGGGATNVVLNLASIARSMVGKVLLVDANFRQPGLASAMGGNDSAAGLGDLLAGQGTLASSVQSLEGFAVLSAGTAPTRLPERLNSAKLDAIFEEARGAYDLIIVDTPPAVVAGEVMTVANRVDASILVVHAWRDQRGLVARLAHQLMDVRSVFLGVILNRPRSTAGGYFKKNAEAIAQYSKARD